MFALLALGSYLGYSISLSCTLYTIYTGLLIPCNVFNLQDREYITVLLHINYVLQGLEIKPSVSVAAKRLPELAPFLSSQSSSRALELITF